MQPDQHQRIMGYFIEEAKDHLNTLEQGLLNLQSTIEDSEMVNEVFRAAHSVKGGAAMLGLNSIQHVSHRLEDFFKILKETPVKVDQKLENLLLRTFDTLKDLLEQLQGPFGLTEEVANNLLAEVEPTFTELEQHLSHLASTTPLAAPVGAGSAAAITSSQKQLSEDLAQLFRSEVPTRLREMLNLFKQADTETTNRHQLQELCRSLSSLGEQYGLSTWCTLIETARKAISHTDNRFATLAPIVIKDIKQAQELVLLGRVTEVAPCDQLLALVPVAVEINDISENDFLDLLSTDADLIESIAEVPETTEFPAAEFAAFASFDLSNTTSDIFEEDQNLQNGPEVGMAELNSLADLFEGEMPELGLTWQQEEIIEEGSELLTPSVGLGQADEAGDFSDLLFDDSMQTSTLNSSSEDFNLFDDELFDEPTSSGVAAEVESGADLGLDDFDDLLQISSSNQPQVSESTELEFGFEEEPEQDLLSFDMSSETADLNLEELSEFTPPAVDLDFESDIEGEIDGALDGLGDLFDGLNEGDLGSSHSQEPISDAAIASSFEEEMLADFDSSDSENLLADMSDSTNSLFDELSADDSLEGLDLELADFPVPSEELSTPVTEPSDIDALFGEDLQESDALESLLSSADLSSADLAVESPSEDLLAIDELSLADLDLDDLTADSADLSTETVPFEAPEVPDPWGSDEIESFSVEPTASELDLSDTSESSGVSLDDLDLSDLDLDETTSSLEDNSSPELSNSLSDDINVFDEPLGDLFSENLGLDETTSSFENDSSPELSNSLSDDINIFDEPLSDLFGEDLASDSTESSEPELSGFDDLSLSELDLNGLDSDLDVGLDDTSDDFLNFGESSSLELESVVNESTDDISATLESPNSTNDVSDEAAQDLEDLFGESSGLEDQPLDDLDLASLEVNDSDELLLDVDTLNFGSDDQLTNLLADDSSNPAGEEAIADLGLELFNEESSVALEANDVALNDNFIDSEALFDDLGTTEAADDFGFENDLTSLHESNVLDADGLAEEDKLEWSSDNLTLDAGLDDELVNLNESNVLDVDGLAEEDNLEWSSDNLTLDVGDSELADFAEGFDNLDSLIEVQSELDNFVDLTNVEAEESVSEIADFADLGNLDGLLDELAVSDNPDDAFNDFLADESLEVDGASEESISETTDLTDFGNLDGLLDESAVSDNPDDAFNDFLADESLEVDTALDDLLSDDVLIEDVSIASPEFTSSFTDNETGANSVTTTDNAFDNLDDLLENDSENLGEIATDDLDSLDSLLDEGNSLNEDAFAGLDDLLGDDSSLGKETTQAPSADFSESFDDFPDLEALLNTDIGDNAVPASTVPIAAVSNSAIADISVDNASQFDDLDDLLKDAEQKMGGTPSVKASRGVAPQARRTARPGRVFSEQTMRVSVKHLDNLSNLVGELVVNRNSLEQDQERLRQSLDNLLYQVQQLSDVGQRMQDLYERSLLESSLLASRHGHRMSAFSIGSRDTSIATHETEHSSTVEYDPLEMDRFTGFHSLSQEMIELIVRVRESSSDIEFIVDETEQVTRMFRQVTTQLQEGLTRSRMVPFAQTADRLPRAVRDISMKIGKQAELVIEGRDTLIDKMILEQLYDPMTHLVNNAITHGIETPEKRLAAGKSASGRITIRAFHQGNQTIISVSDDGAGIDVERVKAKAVEKGVFTRAEIQSMSRLDVFDILFHPGFSTKDQADDFAGRGVGMDVVRTSLSEIRGVINTDSTLGKGTTFTIRLPLTLSISKALCCISDRARIAFPMDGVEDMLDIPKERIQKNAEGHDCIAWRDTILPVHPLADLLGYNRHLGRGNVYGGNQEDDIVSVVVLRSAGNFLALQVDQVLGEQEIVIKQLEGPVPKPVGVAGATVLGDGRIMPIADVLELIDLSMGRLRRDAGGSLWDQGNITPAAEVDIKTEPMVLIVDDSITVRELLSMTFNKVGYRVEQARDGQEAWEKLRSGLPCDIVFCDIEMPRMDGLELLSRIQKDPNLKQLPIAMLTSRGADRHRQMAATLGASGYFTKPYLEEALLDAAQRMLKGERLLTT